MDETTLASNSWERFRVHLASPVSGASVAVFRMAVGTVIALEAYFLCRPYPTAITTGISPLSTYYTGQDIKFHFPFEGFGWLPLLPPNGIYAVVGIMALAGVTAALGLFYRISALILFLGWGYLFAVESTRTYWQSHFYLELLITFLMIWMPAARRYSIDAWMARARGKEHPHAVPFWTVFLLRGQLVIAYFFAGVAKLNEDWLCDAVPMRWFLARAADKSSLATHLSDVHLNLVRSILQSPALAFFMAYTGALFDLLIGLLLLIKRTRFFGLILMVLFHGTNHFLFDDIGLFPLLGLLTASIFLAPDWPEKLWSWLRHPRLSKPDWKWFAAGGITFPVVGAALGWKGKTDHPSGELQVPGRHPYAACFAVVWLLWQALMPLRHYFIAGDARETYEGLSFSWRLKTDTRHAFAHRLYLRDDKVLVSDKTTGRTRIDWDQWHGDQVIYREITPGTTRWQALPPILVLYDPTAGEQVIYNPYADEPVPHSESVARARAARIWMRLYRREPRMVLRPQPFRLIDEGNSPAPFLLIDDPVLFRGSPAKPAKVDRKAWVHADETRSRNYILDLESSIEPLVIQVVDFGWEAKTLLPAFCIFDSSDRPDLPPRIYWNSFADLTASKFIHVSNQPFYLRRYAQRVAGIWEQEYGRRPAVEASTWVSMNGRPYQYLVHPRADLASVPVRWFSHNPWILDLQTERILPQALTEWRGRI